MQSVPYRPNPVIGSEGGPPPSSEPGTRGPVSPHSQKRFRVLIVDDEQTVLDTISAILSEDVDVRTCRSAEQALKMLETGRFHLVCSDFKMPGMNGGDLLRSVASMPVYTSCLLITGANEYIRSRESSHHYVLLKPFDPARLVAIVLQLARLADMKRSVHCLTDSFSTSEPLARAAGFPQPAGAEAAPESQRAPDALGSTRPMPAPPRTPRRSFRG